MKPVFVDASALIALGNQRDNFYSQAQEVRKRLVQSQRKFLTTGFVILELCNAFSNPRLRLTAIRIVESIQQSGQWNYIDASQDLMWKGFDLYRQIQDKSWSLVDCTSIVIARNLAIAEVFTNDHHFEQAGFQILLK